MTSITWEKLEDAAREKVLRVFADVFERDYDGTIYACKSGRKTVFARDCGSVTRLYAAGDEGRIYSLKVFCNIAHVQQNSLGELTRAAAIGIDDDAKWAGVYTNGSLHA